MPLNLLIWQHPAVGMGQGCGHDITCYYLRQQGGCYVIVFFSVCLSCHSVSRITVKVMS